MTAPYRALLARPGARMLALGWRVVDRRGPRALAVLAPVHGVALALVIAGC